MIWKEIEEVGKKTGFHSCNYLKFLKIRNFEILRDMQANNSSTLVSCGYDEYVTAKN